MIQGSMNYLKDDRTEREHGYKDWSAESSNSLEDTPFSGASWIGTDECTSPIICRRFFLPCIRSGILTITGLGYFEARINGCTVSSDRLIPVVSDYEKRSLTDILYPCHDHFTHRIYYCRFDVAHLLKEGENLLEIQLGCGWYRQTERVAEGKLSYGDTLKTIYHLQCETDEAPVSVLSDGSEQWYASEIVYNNLFIGEIHDRQNTSRTKHPVRRLPAPNAELNEQIGVPDRVIRRIVPQKLGKIDGRTIYDVGENISGVVRVKSRGGKVVLRFAENRNQDGSLNFDTTGSRHICSSGKPQVMTDTFFGVGWFEPKFVWHAFRFFDVEGNIDQAEVLVIHSNTAVTSSFDSSSEGLNFLYDAYIRTQLNNMHGSIPSDCPHRERLGYTGDGQNCAEAGMMLLDSREFYRKWIRDILDCQDRASGHIQHTAPFQGGGGGPGGWGCAVVIVPYVYYRQYGDRAMLDQCYDAMRRWIGYLTAHSENGLVVREEEGGWCLGDWCTPTACLLPEPFVNTYFMVRSLRMLAEIAHEIGRDEDVSEYRTLDAKCCDAMKRKYFQNGHFCNGVQGADAYAIDIGIAPPEAVDWLAEKYEQTGMFDTGFLGTDVLLRVLFENGYSQVALQLLDQECGASFLKMKRCGATTLWERWNGGSHDHPMFGGCTRYLFQYILGIGQKGYGWANPFIAPQIPKTLSYAKGEIATVRGTIAVQFSKDHSNIQFDIQIPTEMQVDFEYLNVHKRMGQGHHTFIISCL